MKSKPEVVISGIAGNFPKSENFTEFQKNLFEAVNLVADDSQFSNGKCIHLISGLQPLSSWLNICETTA